MPRILPLLLSLPLLLTAQIEIDLVEVEVDPVEAEGIETPEARDHSTPAVRAADALHFLNRNELTGKLMELGADTVTWKHPDAEAPLVFSSENVKQVQLRTDAEALEELLTLPRILLTNGDVYRGSVRSLRDGSLRISSSSAGDVSIQESMIRSVNPNALSSSLYEGPDSEDWSFRNMGGGETNWFYRDGALYANDRNLLASLQPEELPDRYTLSMDLEWKGMLNVQIAFWGAEADNPNPNSNAYVISLQNNYLRVYRNYNNVGRNNFVNQQIQHELQDGSTAFKLHLDKKTKQMIILLDDTVLGQWRDVFDGRIRGDLLMLYTQANSAMRVTNIRIQEWDGGLRTVDEEVESQLDRVLTTNGDEFAGEVKGIQSGVLTFENEFAEFSVPLERIQEIRFASEGRATQRLMPGDVKLRTETGETITLQLEQMRNGTLSGTSETTGDLEVLLRYFSEIQFNPYDDRHEQDGFLW